MRKQPSTSTDRRNVESIAEGSSEGGGGGGRVTNDIGITSITEIDVIVMMMMTTAVMMMMTWNYAASCAAEFFQTRKLPAHT